MFVLELCSLKRPERPNITCDKCAQLTSLFAIKPKNIAAVISTSTVSIVRQNALQTKTIRSEELFRKQMGNV